MAVLTKEHIRDRHFFSVITPGVLCEFVSTAPRTVTKWCDNGKLPCYRLPNGNVDKPDKQGTDRRIRIGDAIRFCRQRGLHEAAMQLMQYAKPSVVVIDVPDAVVEQVKQFTGPYQVTVRHCRHIIQGAAEIGRRPTIGIVVGGWVGLSNLNALFIEADISADQLGWICGKVVMTDNGEPPATAHAIHYTPATADVALKQLAPFLPLRTEVLCDGDSCRQADCGTCSSKQDDRTVHPGE